MKNVFFYLSCFSLCFILIYLSGCSVQSDNNQSENITKWEFDDDEPESQSLGTVGNGKLVDGKPLPAKGNNFEYFSTISFLAGRHYVHSRVRKTMLEAYQLLEKSYPNRKFYIMECSNKNGGKLEPHITHQNGLSVDFMSLLLRNGQIFTDYDLLGSLHYAMDFNNEGYYLADTLSKIDFEAIALHLTALSEASKTHKVKITRVLFKTELLPHLFTCPSGKKLQQLQLNFATYLPPKINAQHDDHYHVDFEIIR